MTIWFHICYCRPSNAYGIGIDACCFDVGIIRAVVCLPLAIEQTVADSDQQKCSAPSNAA
jgi:hypothetical protein